MSQTHDAPFQLPHDANRRRLLQAMGAASLAGLPAWSQAQPTSAVNTTKLAVTDSEVVVGQLHSSTGTMAISETGSIQAEQLAIDQINAMGGVLGRKIRVIKEDGASDWPTFAEKAKKLLISDHCAAVFGCWTSASRKAVLPVSRKRTACSTTPPSTKAWSSPRTSSTPARKPRSRSSTASTGRRRKRKPSPFS